MAIKDWYTTSDLATHAGISRKTIWRWIHDGKLKSTRYGVRHRIPESEWQRFLETCNQEVRNDGSH